jgi:Rho guanine nucleotide exchange factor 12
LRSSIIFSFQDVINELFHTERSHVRNLKVLDSVFRRPLTETGRMPHELLDRLFPNLGDVLALHQRHSTAMRERVAAGGGFPVREIGDILTGMFLEGNGDTLVRIGGEFIKNQNSTIEELKRMRSR